MVGEILGDTIKFHGCEKQALIAAEELSELIKAICKLSRHGLSQETRTSVKEEMADALIMIYQFQSYLEMTDTEIYEEIRNKVSKRLREGVMVIRRNMVGTGK